MAGVALCASEKVSKVILCDRCTVFAGFSEHDLHFWWHLQHFVNVNSIYVRVGIWVRGLHFVFCD